MFADHRSQRELRLSERAVNGARRPAAAVAVRVGGEQRAGGRPAASGSARRIGGSIVLVDGRLQPTPTAC
jgi:hypothetical protein